MNTAGNNVIDTQEYRPKHEALDQKTGLWPALRLSRISARITRRVFPATWDTFLSMAILHD